MTLDPKPQYGTGRFDEKPVPDANPRPPEPPLSIEEEANMRALAEAHPIIRTSTDPVAARCQQDRARRVKDFMKRKRRRIA